MKYINKKLYYPGKKILKFISKYNLFLLILMLTLTTVSGVVYVKTGKEIRHTSQIAQGFPNIPVYPNATLIKSVSDPHEGETYIGVKYSSTWRVKATVSQVSKWYMDKLRAAGWVVDVAPGNINSNDIQLITFFNDFYSLNMSFIKNQNTNLTDITSEFSTRYSDTKEPGEEEGE